jgi:hypothetical protein
LDSSAETVRQSVTFYLSEKSGGPQHFHGTEYDNQPQSARSTLELQSHMAVQVLQWLPQPASNDLDAKNRRQKTIRSNAARAAHAEVRRARMKQHEAAKHRDAAESRGNSHQPAECLTIMRVLPAGRIDPLNSFCRPFTPMEHFLLDHCVLSPIFVFPVERVLIKY